MVDPTSRSKTRNFRTSFNEQLWLVLNAGYSTQIDRKRQHHTLISKRRLPALEFEQSSSPNLIEAKFKNLDTNERWIIARKEASIID